MATKYQNLTTVLVHARYSRQVRKHTAEVETAEHDWNWRNSGRNVIGPVSRI